MSGTTKPADLWKAANPGTAATAMKSANLWSVLPADNLAHPGLVLGPGTIQLSCAASNTGQVRWLLNYEKIEYGALVT